MADSHQRRADDDGTALAEHAIGKQAAEDRREINEAGIEAIDLRSQRLQVERTEHGLKCRTEHCEAKDIVNVRLQQQIFDHVKDEQRAHPVIGKAFPHFGREQESQTARMAEQLSAAAAYFGKWMWGGHGTETDMGVTMVVEKASLARFSAGICGRVRPV